MSRLPTRRPARSEKQLYCRACGQAIAKRTEAIIWGHQASAPPTREEAVKGINTRIMSVRHHHNGAVYGVYTWDGESYQDRDFCTDRCAVSWAKLNVADVPPRTY